MTTTTVTTGTTVTTVTRRGGHTESLVQRNPVRLIAIQPPSLVQLPRRHSPRWRGPSVPLTNAAAWPIAAAQRRPPLWRCMEACRSTEVRQKPALQMRSRPAACSGSAMYSGGRAMSGASPTSALRVPAWQGVIGWWGGVGWGWGRGLGGLVVGWVVVWVGYAPRSHTAQRQSLQDRVLFRHTRTRTQPDAVAVQQHIQKRKLRRRRPHKRLHGRQR